MKRFLHLLSGFRRQRPDHNRRLLALYRELRRELLPGSSVLVRTDASGQPFIQDCRNCGSLDLEEGEWLGDAFRCRECKVILIPGEHGAVAVQPTEWSRPPAALFSQEQYLGERR